MPKKIDMTGWKMSEHGVSDSRWTVLEYAGHSKWKCVCQCGAIKEIAGSSLRSGGSKSCGKCGTKKNKTIDMTGWKMWEHGVPDSKIIVIKQIQRPDKAGHALWECKCNCGNETTFNVDGCNLRTGHTLSCGCLRKGLNSKDREGQKFGMITIGKSTGKIVRGSYLYECFCDCGNKFFAIPTRVINGHVQSCGCLTSKGEVRLRKLLMDLNIPFKQEYSLYDLLSESGNPRRMDFAIFTEEGKLKAFIEYQGEQHYSPNSNWYRPGIDEQKREYCRNHNIPLIEIPYTDYDILNEEYIKNVLSF